MKLLTLAFAIASIVLLSSFTTLGDGDKANPVPEGTESQVQYRIQLASYDLSAPTNDQQLFDQIGGVTEMDSKGKKVYITAPFKSEKDAALKLPEFRQMGFKGAKKVVILDNYVVSAKTYHFFYDNKKCSAADKQHLFQTEYRTLD